MSDNIAAGAGTKIYIGTTASASNQAEYESDTYTLVEQTEAIGTFGDSSAEVTFVGLENSRVVKKKGSRDAGNLSVTMALSLTALTSSPLGGQGVMLAAAEDSSSADYNFKVEYNDGDNSTSPDGTPSIRYFSGQVATFQEAEEGADEIIMATCEVRVNTGYLRVGAS